jgi:hypothetical protein
MTASCWYNEFCCEAYKTANITFATVAELRELKREHEDYWSDETMRLFYGYHAPFGYKYANQH